MDYLDKYYNKFNEDKRLLSRHGNLEFITSMKYIHESIDRIKADKDINSIKILDVGAGTGRYSISLSEEGHDVTAVEFVKHNLSIIKLKSKLVKAYQGNAIDLSRFQDDSFDLTLVFGPMYHLYTYDDKLQALNEAKRVTRKGGIILIAYYMNEYCVLSYGFKKKFIKESIEKGKLTEDFHIISSPEDLYDMVRLEDIDRLNKDAGIERIKIIASDGPANYMRQQVNALSEEEYNLFIKYHLSTCERMDLMGASGHTVDILQV